MLVRDDPLNFREFCTIGGGGMTGYCCSPPTCGRRGWGCDIM